MTSTGSSSSAGAAEAGAADAGAAPAQTQAQPQPPLQAQIVVALASYNDATTIGQVASAIDAGLRRDFAGAHNSVLLADAGSTDATVAKARDALGLRPEDLIEVPAPRRLRAGLLDVPYHGLPGRARALRALLAAARDRGAASCVVLDASVTSLTADWLQAMAQPVFRDGYDYAAPFYVRSAYEGALTKGIVYPLLRALYGVRLRQPAASEFACSQRMLDLLLDEELWDRDGVETGVDVWLGAAAAVSRQRLCEVPLGPRAHRSRGEDRLDLRAILTQVVGAVFADLEARADIWQRIRQSTPVPLAGEPSPIVLDAAPVAEEAWLDGFRLGYRELREIWSAVLPPKAIIELRKLAVASDQGFQLDPDLWARIVYDFALAYRMRVLPRDHLLGSLTPLYLGWLTSFVRQVRGRTMAEHDACVERNALAFEAQKPYLVSRWRWPESFRT